MNKTIILTIIGLLIYNSSFGQDRKGYSELISEAQSLYKSKDYLKSAEKYSEAFVVFGDKVRTSDRYNASCSWALAKVMDSSFVQLFKIGENGNYTNYKHISTDTDLSILHSDERWNKVIELVIVNKEKTEANLDKPLIAILDTIYQEDQKYRQQINVVKEKYGWKSDEMKAHWKLINKKDSINLIKIQEILDERGWLGSDIIGDQGNKTIFLVIQHSDLEIQEKYLPMMRDAVKNGHAKASGLALLVDRVAIRKGEKQTYGSQVGMDQETKEYFVFPLLDPDNVDVRRAEVGLGKLHDYLSRFGLAWNVEAYKIHLAIEEAATKP